MSYGSGRERKRQLREMSSITRDNVAGFLRLAGAQYISDYPSKVNSRASDKETATDKSFLSAVAGKNFTNAFSAFQRDANSSGLAKILEEIMSKQTSVDPKSLSEEMKQYFRSNDAKGQFHESARAGIRRILQSPLQSGLSRTVLQKYLQK